AEPGACALGAHGETRRPARLEARERAGLERPLREEERERGEQEQREDWRLEPEVVGERVDCVAPPEDGGDEPRGEQRHDEDREQQSPAHPPHAAASGENPRVSCTMRVAASRRRSSSWSSSRALANFTRSHSRRKARTTSRRASEGSRAWSEATSSSVVLSSPSNP